MGGGFRSKCCGQYRHQVVNDPIGRGLAGGEQDGQRAGGQVGAQMDQHQQHPHRQRQPPRAAGSVWQHLLCQQVDGADLAGGEPGQRHQAPVSAREWVDVGGWCFHEAMASASTDTTTAISGDVVVRRGKSKAPNFKYEGPVSVIRLELDASDDLMRRRLERHWEAVFRLRRALQRDAADRCRAYWAARHERKRDPKALRDRLGLTRKGMEAAAKAHIEASGWMADHLTKATGLHVAAEVWETVDRHLFADKSGRRHGPPRVGSWWDFARIAGRARSHTKATPTWETYGLVGSLDGHLNAYRHPVLPASITCAGDAAGRAGRRSWRSRPRCRHQLGQQAVPGGNTTAPWRWCSPGCRPGTWCCRCGCARCRTVGSPASFPGRPACVAQDRPGAGGRPPGTGWLALLRPPADSSSRIPVRINQGTAQ